MDSGLSPRLATKLALAVFMLCGIATLTLADTASLIDQKYYSLGGPRSFLGSPVTPELTAPDGVGRYRHYQGGSIYWSPRTGAHEIHGAIRDKWASSGWERGYGYPTTDESVTPDGRGRYNHFEGNRSIYWTPQTGAHAIFGAIRDKWAGLGWERGYGYPITDELVTPDGRGRYNHFEGNRSIYWTPQTGAHAIFGAIRDKWASLGWERSWLGYPTTDETGTADGFWRFNHFEGGSVLWSLETGVANAHASGKPKGESGRDPYWGLLASPGFEGQPMKSVYFFAGDWRFHEFRDPECGNAPGFKKFYEYCAGANDNFYTIHPSESEHLGWSESVEYRRFALDRMAEAGVNVINMSYWGKRGSDRWVYWAPMHTSTWAHDELFDVAAEKNLLIAPYIEGGACTDCNDPVTGRPRGGNSPAFEFADDFPGTPQDPSPALVEQIVDLVERYLLYPEKPEWPARWAQMYDQFGGKRYVISLIHARSRQDGVDDYEFARGLDLVAFRVALRTGVQVGFTLDVTPDHGAYYPTPTSAGDALSGAQSLLAIECFIPEVSQAWAYSHNQPHPSGHTYGEGGPRQGEPILIDTLDLGQLISWKENFVKSWVETGIPVILDVAPGYDGHIVFAQPKPGDPFPLVWGNNDQWRNAQTGMIALGVRGITFNTWNGYTEGYAAVPTLEFGDASYRWLQSLNALIP
ncbi:MAG TPA: hypothetical protein VFD58_10365 [Blastocatellia bacterium]|nr:hypothetical protein [Blastocatellia bacterium]